MKKHRMSVYKMENMGQVCPNGKELLVLCNIYRILPNTLKGVDDFLNADTMLTVKKCPHPEKF
jgi:hypothetical protein